MRGVTGEAQERRFFWSGGPLVARMAQAEDLKVVSFNDGAAGLGGVGAELRAARMREGLELAAVSDGLRIRYQHLEAIENSDFDALPGPAYAVGFVRSYANHLGLDGDEFVRRFKEEVAGFSPQQDLRFPEPPPEGRLPKGIVVVLSVVVAVGVFLAWQYLAGPRDSGTPVVAEVPERLTEPEATPLVTGNAADDGASTPVVSPGSGDRGADAPAASEPALSAPASQDEVAVATGPAAAVETETMPADSAVAPGEAPATPVSNSGPSSEAPAEAPASPPAPQQMIATAPSAADATEAEEDLVSAPTAEETPVAEDGDMAIAAINPAAPADPAVASPDDDSLIPAAPGIGEYVPRVYGQGNTDARVVLRARDDSWVQVQGRNNELLLTRILRAGDTYRVPDRNDLVLISGNAGGLEVIVDGRAIPALGRPGTVVRNVSLDPARLLAESGSR